MPIPTQNGPTQIVPAPERKSWVARHKIITGAFVLFIAVVVGGLIFAWPLMKLRFHSQYVTALEEIRKDKGVIEKLGEPIDPVRLFPGGSVTSDGTSGSATIYFDVSGPKGNATVSVFSRLLQGEWGFTKLELKFSDDSRIDIASKLQQAAGDDTPRFNPNAAQPTAQKPDMPMKIEVNIPDPTAIPAK